MEKKIVNLEVKTNLDISKKEFFNFKKGIDDSKNSAEKLNETVSETGKKGSVFSNLSKGIGGLIPGFKGAEAAGQGVLKTMWAIVANPLGAVIAAVVLALGALYKAFASTKAGGEKIEQLMSGLGAVMDVLRDRVLKIGSAIAKFLTGDFSGAFKDAKNAASGMGDEIEKEFKQAAEAKKYLQEVDDALRSLSVSRAKLNRDLAKSKEIITDENASYAQKKKAIDEVRIAEEKQTQAELANAEKKLKAIKLENSLSDTSKENLDKQAAAEAELYALQQKSAEDKRAIRKTEERADKEEEAKLKSIVDERNARAKEANEKAKAIAKEKYDNEKTLIDELVKNEKLSFEEKRKNINEDRILTQLDKEKYLKEVNAQELKSTEEHLKAISDLENKYKTDAENREATTALQKLDLERKRAEDEINNIAKTEEEKNNLRLLLNADYNAKLKEINDANEKERTAVEDANFKARLEIDKLEYEHKRKMLDATTALLDTAAGALGDSTVAGKAAAVASATIKTLLSSVDAFQGMVSAIPGPAGIAAGIAASGFAVLSGFKAVKGILAVKTPKSNSGASISASVPTVTAAAPQFNVVGNSGTNQIAQTLANQNQAPIQTYVVASSVTTAQSLDRNIISNASIG